MKAVLLNRITEGSEISLSEVPVPDVKPGWVLIKVMAFGMNHSEQVLRLEEFSAPYIKKPVIPGIECVGIVEEPGDTRFVKGQKVCGLMGGMGRRFDGSYAEYVLLPEKNVFVVNTDLPWDQFAAVPETYFTAWGSLFEGLRLLPEDILLIRGATCALGYVAIQIAKALGCRVVATTHRESKMKLLKETGVDEIVLDEGVLTGKISGITKALELVGPGVLKDTLTAVDKGAIVCNTGILAGPEVMSDFNPIFEIPNGVYLTGYYSNYPTQKDMDEIFAFIAEHKLEPRIGAVYAFDDIRSACTAQDTKGKVDGKIVVVM